VANCPTSDNVMVKVDVSFNFQIGPDIKDVETFVYTLGAGRLQELLQAETEEAIRTLVFGNPVLRIRDLREELSRSMHNALNRSVNQYGVTIRNIRITSTELPADLDQTLSDTTGFKSKLISETKTHEATMQKLVDDEKQKNLSLEKNYERQCQEVEAECQKAVIDRKQYLVKATGKMNVAVTNAKAATQAMITQASAAKRDAATLAEKHMIEVTLKAEYEANEKIVAARQQLATATLDGESMVAVAKSKAAGVMAESEAEALASAQMEEARQHEIELQRLGIMRQLASQGKMVITGKLGEDILKFMAPGSSADKTHEFTTGQSK
jgi:regulator of protease activity HflC (stomatin/prohibitin superfamily)